MKAVITGDIIHSTKMASDERKSLIQAIDRLLKQMSKDFEMRSEIYRGDSFQCLINNPKNALRAALLIKTFVRGQNPDLPAKSIKQTKSIKITAPSPPVWTFDARIAVGIGEIEQLGKKLGTSHGEAFLLSGHLLDELKQKKQALGIHSSDIHSEELETEAILLDFIISRTTALQCEVLHFKLLENTETWIANELKINQSAVNQRSNSAGWNAINTLVQRFEKMYTDGK